MAIPTPYDASSGQFVTDSILDAGIRDVFNFLLSPPRCKCYKSVDAGIADSTWILLNWDTEEYDDATRPSHSTATNPSRLIAPEAGIYPAGWTIRWQANGTAVRKIEWRKNGTGVVGGVPTGTLILDQVVPAIAGGEDTYNDGIIDVPLAAGDYLELFVWQNSGLTLQVRGGIGKSSISWRWAAL